MDSLSSSDSHVPHVLSPTLFANLKVGVSMKFSQIFGRDATLAMKAINILTHNKFEVILLLQLYHSHMSLGRVSLLD